MPLFNRRQFCVAAAATVAAGPLGFPGLFRRYDAMADTPSAAGRTTGSDGIDIRAFRVSFPDAELDDLRRRIKATRWPDRETVTDQSQGVQLGTTQKLARHWATEYDWRKCEKRLNALPQ